MACPPDGLIDALTARAPELHDVQISQLCPMGKVPYAAPELAGAFRLTTPFIIGPEIREAVAAGRADFMPVFLSEIPRLFANRYPVDWALVQLSPPDRHGFCSTGISVDATLSALRNARHILAEVNPRMPRTLGDTVVHVDRLDAITETDHPLFELPPPPVSDVFRLSHAGAGPCSLSRARSYPKGRRNRALASLLALPAYQVPGLRTMPPTEALTATGALHAAIQTSIGKWRG